MTEFYNDLKVKEFIKDDTKQTLRPPSMYQVVLNNDDYTPMEFVVDVLQKFFFL